MTERDTSTTLSTGSGGDLLDMTAVLEADFDTGAAPESVGNRQRLVLGGELGRTVIGEPRRIDGGYALLIEDVELRRTLRAMLDQRLRREELIREFVTLAQLR